MRDASLYRVCQKCPTGRGFQAVTALDGVFDVTSKLCTCNMAETLRLPSAAHDCLDRRQDRMGVQEGASQALHGKWQYFEARLHSSSLGCALPNVQITSRVLHTRLLAG